MVRHIYKLTNSEGETKTIDSIKNTASFLGVVVSTVCKYAKNGRELKGWKIEETVVDSGNKVVEKVVNKPRKRYKEDGWKFDKFFKQSNVCCVAKSYCFDFNAKIDYEKLKFYLQLAVKRLIENDIELENDYILHIKIPEYKYVLDITQYQILYFELHIKFKEHKNFIDEINYIKQYTSKIEEFIYEYISNIEME